MKFLDYKHGAKWAIWEFRAEGTGYPDSEVYNRIRHYPWPDHHPPPFALIPNIMASMRDWLKGPTAEKGRVAVVHCKAGKGRSGTVATSYLISEEGWSVENATKRFTARRMRNGFGSGISIPSQVRWVGYVDWWTKHGKIYVERQIEIVELHVWGLRDGVKVAIEGYVDEGRVIKTFHTFAHNERTLMEDQSTAADTLTKGEKPIDLEESKSSAAESETITPSTSAPDIPLTQAKSSHEPALAAALFRPSSPLILPTSDINIDFERRNKAKYGLTMVTSVAHVWFNAFFESQEAFHQSVSKPDATPSSHIHQAQNPDPTNPPTSGVFSIDWDAMDGIKGSARKGTRAIDRLSVVWRAAPTPPATSPHHPKELTKIITQPAPGASIPDTGPASKDSPANTSTPSTQKSKNLGLRAETPGSASISRASSPASGREPVDDDDSEVGVKTHGPAGEERIPYSGQNTADGEDAAGMARANALPGSEEHFLGQILKN